MPSFVFSTAFGPCGVAWNDAGLTAFGLPEADVEAVERRLAVHGERIAAEDALPAWLPPVIARVQAHFAGRMQDFADVPLDWARVSAFQQSVYRQTLAIKPGYKKSYGEIARLLGAGNEIARAVGVALGANPWPLIVPCHRVVSASDKMTGFSGPGGIRTKTRLLALEGAEVLSE